jgi:hypothetical protein
LKTGIDMKLKPHTSFFIYLSLAFFLTVYSFRLFGEDASEKVEVMLSSDVESKRVPLNRPLVLTVRVSWEGDIDYIEIDEIEEPVLSNFEIVGTASSNRVVGTENGRKAEKEIRYTLMPTTLGMGYVESVALSYLDKLSDQTYHLKTERIGVEVVAPVAEKGKNSSVWIPLLAGVLILGGGFIFILRFRRKKADRTKEEAVEDRILEEDYLATLKNSVDLKSRDKREMFSTLSNLFRKYLSEKYSIAALEATTEGLLKIMEENHAEEGLIHKCSMLLKKADVIKFSRQEATQAELDEAYTTVEAVFESHLAQAKKEILKNQEAHSQKKKRFRLK